VRFRTTRLAYQIARMHRQSLLLKVETSKRTHDSRGFTYAELNPSIQLNAVPERTGSGRNPC
jgi:phage FluMu gp28-like protein